MLVFGIAPRSSCFLAATVIATLGVSSVAEARHGGSYWKHLYRVKGENQPPASPRSRSAARFGTGVL
jgi:hypothetical protein